MVDLIAALPATGWQRVAIDALWQSSLAGLAALILARIVGSRPALRAAIALVGLALCIATPALSALARHEGWGLLVRETAARSTAEAPTWLPVKMISSYDMSSDLPSGAATSSASSPQRPFGDRGIMAWLGLAWGVASGTLVVRLLRDAVAVRRLLKATIPCQSAEIQAPLARAAGCLQIPQPLLVESPTCAAPTLVAWGRPRIIVPVARGADIDWFAVFCHELAHLARRDGLARLLVEFGVVCLPWQPIVWLLRREFRAACEEACDDYAVAAGVAPVELAAQLVEFIPRRRSTFALGMADSPAAVRHRILRLLTAAQLPRPRLGRAWAIGGWIAAAALAGVIALVQYRSSRAPVEVNLPPWGNQPLSQAIAKALPVLKVQRPGPYVIEPPDILLIDAVNLKAPGFKNIVGEHLVGPDGTVNLGIYGTVYVAGMTIAEATKAVEEKLSNQLEQPRISIDVVAYNSKVYYVITEKLPGPWNPQGSLTRVPITGNETVLDALAQRGFRGLSGKNIWIARPTVDNSTSILPVDWDAITGRRETTTNYQVLPGDRIVVQDKEQRPTATDAAEER